MTSLVSKIFLFSLLSQCLAAPPPQNGHQGGPPASGPTPPNLARDAATLKAWGRRVTSDPQGVIRTWQGDNPCKGWKGVYCEKSPLGYLAVASFDINGFHLGHDLPLSGLLDKLADLALFHANSNEFAGTVPQLTAVPYLYELDLSNNHLSGSFPLTVLQPKLKFLDIRFNHFSGPLPGDLFTNRNVENIFINNNAWTGTLPQAQGLSCKRLSIANNRLTGPIPESFASIKGLSELLLLGNQLSGTVPEELCALNLKVLDVRNNPWLSKQLGPKCQALKRRGVLHI